MSSQPQVAIESIRSVHLTLSFSGQSLSTGTGFFARSRSGRICLITNRHNVTGRDQNTGKTLSPTLAIPNALTIRMPILGAVPPNYRTGAAGGQQVTWADITVNLLVEDQPQWVEHPALGERADFVAIPLDDLPADEQLLYEMVTPIDRQILLLPTDHVSIIGFPLGMAAGQNLAIWVNGTVASDPDVSYNELPVMLVDCRGRPGQSGSPVIAFRSGGMVKFRSGDTAVMNGPVSNFIGIYSGRIHKDSDIGMVWKAEAIQQLLATI
ncbi:trypsin-like serine peptidase [Paraburkholderia sp. MM5477-R1]|uniref:trypsin-like serine peptidase n=1 Tax=Paraburkholderia sp. MM5477-R1 TaxID=2991062 RepID=UPI003D1A47FE